MWAATENEVGVYCCVSEGAVAMIQVVLISSCYEQQEMWLHTYGVIFKYILL